MKAKISIVATVSVMVTLLMGCSGSLPQEDYVAWVRDYGNGLHVEKESGDYVFDLQYTPVDFVWLQYKDRPREELKGMQYYTLTIRPKDNATDLVDYNVFDAREKQQRLYYLAYSFQDDVRLEESGASLPCVLFHFEKAVDLKNSRTFLLGFEDVHPDVESSRLVIESEQFGSLPITIKVSKQNIPSLKYDNRY